MSWNIYTAPLVSHWLMAIARKQFPSLSDQLCWEIERFLGSRESPQAIRGQSHRVLQQQDLRGIDRVYKQSLLYG